MRIPSGVTDQYIYFIALDATDFVTPETGLSSFTVYRSRNGGTATAYTTPTITEVSSANMPGWYKLLLDEDMTIDSGDDSQEVALHITATGMAPARRVFELYRPKATAGQTLTVASGIGQASVQSIAANAITATSIATDAITAGKIAADAIGASELAADAATEIGTAVWASAARTLTANTNLNDLSAAGVRAAVGLASANLDTQIGTLATAANLATVDTVVDAIQAKTDNLPTDPADQSIIIAATDAILAAVGDVPTNAELSTALAAADDAVLAQVALVKAKTDLIPASPAAVGDIPSADITAIKAKTDSLNFTVAGQVDANIQYVNDVQVNGTGAAGNEWGP